jgi:hypothetical protein
MNFMSGTLLGKERRNRGWMGVMVEWLGNSQHLWMWDYKSIKCELQKAGFINIRRAEFGDSSRSVFQDVEDPKRWENCLGIECGK